MIYLIITFSPFNSSLILINTKDYNKDQAYIFVGVNFMQNITNTNLRFAII